MEEITALIDDVAAGIAARDPDRCVARFVPDVRSVTNVRLVGRDAVRQAHVDAFASPKPPPADPSFTVVDAVFVRPDVAVVTTEATGGRPATTVVTWTLVHEDDGWWVAARTFSPVAA